MGDVMETNLIPFQFESHSIRVVMIENEPWCVAADICSTLDISNPSQAMTRLDDDERQLFDLNTLCSNEGIQGNSYSIGV